MPPSKLTSGERLQRKGQPPAAPRARHQPPLNNLIIVGASAGGYRVLMEILRDLPSDIPAAIVIILHMPLGSSHDLAQSLARSSRLPIVTVEEPTALRQGTIFLPPPGRSMIIRRGKLIVEDLAETNERPRHPTTTINRLFTSAAKAYGARVIGVILSGLLRDGSDGLRAVHEAGGVTLVQDPLEAEYDSMPASAMKDLPVTFCLKLSDIGPALELLVRRGTEFETGLAVAVRTLMDRAALLVRLGEQSWRNPSTHEFLMTELASLQHDLQSIERLMHRVLVKSRRPRRTRGS